MTYDNISLRKSIIGHFDSIVNQNLRTPFVAPSEVYQPKNRIPFIIKKYHKKDAFSRNLHNTLPMSKQSNFLIQGPLGRGLELLGRPKGKHIILACGTGLLPFLDLLNYILMKSMYDIVKEKIDSSLAESLNVFKESYDTVLDPSFKVELYASFSQESDIAGLDILIKLAEISAVFGTSLFKAKIRGYKSDTIAALEKKFDITFLTEIIQEDYERVYVCGSPKFNLEMITILKTLGVNRSKLFIV